MSEEKLIYSGSASVDESGSKRNCILQNGSSFVCDADKLKHMFETSHIALLLCDDRGTVISANAACKQVIGVPVSLLIGKTIYEFLDNACSNSLSEVLVPGVNDASAQELVLQVQESATTKRSIRTWVSELKSSPVAGRREFQIALVDASRQQYVADQLMQARDYLEKLATHDALTGLPNRVYFIDALRSVMFEARKGKRRIALLYFDIDGFKSINDRYGHMTGDALLCEISNRLRTRVRDVGTLARLGGDEFTLIVQHAGNDEALQNEAQTVLAAIREPVAVASDTLRVSASIGIAVYPEFARNPEQLIQFADAAMYRAKSAGGNCAVKYSVEQHSEMHRMNDLKNDFQAALSNSDFVLNFQPIVDVRDGSADTYEVLSRWQHRKHGLIGPDQFIPIAERSGQIQDFGYWVIRKTCELCQDFCRRGLKVRFAVNVSPFQLSDKDLPKKISELFREFNISPDSIEIEITESALIEELEGGLNLAMQLKEIGCSLALDDFGTGYSSLARLTELPISRVKLDRHFTSELEHSESVRAVVCGVIDIAHRLNLSVVAEGVETEKQQELLRSYSCDFLQGHWLDEPFDEAHIHRSLSTSYFNSSGNTDTRVSSEFTTIAKHRLVGESSAVPG